MRVSFPRQVVWKVYQPLSSSSTLSHKEAQYTHKSPAVLINFSLMLCEDLKTTEDQYV